MWYDNIGKPYSVMFFAWSRMKGMRQEGVKRKHSRSRREGKSPSTIPWSLDFLYSWKKTWLIIPCHGSERRRIARSGKCLSRFLFKRSWARYITNKFCDNNVQLRYINTADMRNGVLQKRFEKGYSWDIAIDKATYDIKMGRLCVCVSAIWDDMINRGWSLWNDTSPATPCLRRTPRRMSKLLLEFYMIWRHMII